MGKKLRKNAAATNPQVSSKKIVLPDQNLRPSSDPSGEEGGDESGEWGSREQAIRHYEKQLSHVNSKSRVEAVKRLSKQLRQTDSLDMESNITGVAVKVAQLIADKDEAVRTASRRFLGETLFPRASSGWLSAHMRIVMLHICSGLSHVLQKVRHDALLTLNEGVLPAVHPESLQQSAADVLKRLDGLLRTSNTIQRNSTGVKTLGNDTLELKLILQVLVGLLDRLHAQWVISSNAVEEKRGQGEAGRCYESRSAVLDELVKFFDLLVDIWRAAAFEVNAPSGLGDTESSCMALSMRGFVLVSRLVSALTTELAADGFLVGDTNHYRAPLLRAAQQLFDSGSMSMIPLRSPAPSASSTAVQNFCQVNISCAEAMSVLLRYGTLEGESLAFHTSTEIVPLTKGLALLLAADNVGHALRVLQFLTEGLRGTALPSSSVGGSVNLTESQMSTYSRCLLVHQ